jgi:hypothetical protein
MLTWTRAVAVFGQKASRHINPAPAKLSFMVLILARPKTGFLLSSLTVFTRSFKRYCYTHIIADLWDFVKLAIFDFTFNCQLYEK